MEGKRKKSLSVSTDLQNLINMAYNRKNLLSKIIEIQQTTLEHKKKGSTQKWIYENVIEQKYCICQATYNNYLATNAKKELNDMERAKHETK